MLVTFTCPAYANITMFGDEAIQLLKMMGHSGTVPSAILAKDVSTALKRLENSLDSSRELPVHSVEEEGDEPVVPLSHRAIPLIDLLKAAVKSECDVMWDNK